MAKKNKNKNKKKLPYKYTDSNLVDRFVYISERIEEVFTGSCKTKNDNNTDNKIVILITDKFQLGLVYFFNV
jgi:hypothetical protein